MATDVDDSSIVAALEAKVRRLQRAIDTIMGDVSTVNYDPHDQTVMIKTSHRGLCRCLPLMSAAAVATEVMPMLPIIPYQDRCRE